MSLQETILNALIVSIPEEFFITMIILILLGRYDYIAKENWKQNLLKIMIIAVVPVAAISTILRFFTSLDNNTMLLINIICFVISMILLNDGIKSIKEGFKIILFTVLGILIFMITQMITIFILVYGLNTTIESFNQSAFLNFTLFIPERLIQYFILAIVFLRQNSLTRVNLSKMILENKFLKFFTILFTVIDVCVLLAMLKYFVFENMLQTLSIKHQVVASVIGISLVIINLLSIWIITLCIYPVEIYKQKYKI